MVHVLRKEAATPERKPDVEKHLPARAIGALEELDRLFDRLLPRGWMRPFRWDYPAWMDFEMPLEPTMPRIDVIDRANEFLVKAELPGVEKNDLEIALTERMVTIKGHTMREEKEEKGEFFRHETYRGEFARSVILPAEVEGTKATATFRDGVLELTLPKAETAKRHLVKIE